MQSIKRFLGIFFGGLAMFLIALVCAFLSLRIAIHGREVEVPNLAGRSDADAAATARKLGLNLSVENRFYSPAMAPNQVLSQLPVAGSRVRRGWQVRVTESLGPQIVSVPDVTGQNERPASLVMRRLQLDVGTIAHLPAPAPAGIVLAQSPPPNSKGLNGPRVALLVSDVETAADAPAFVMPSITGLTLSAASLRLSSAGLHIASAEAAEDTPASDAGSPQPAAPPPDLTASTTYAQPVTVTATIIGQSPSAGHRVTRADAIRVVLSH